MIVYRRQHWKSTEGLRSCNRGSLLKHPTFEGHDCFTLRQQVWVNPRGSSVQSLSFLWILYWIRVIYCLLLLLAIQTLITSNNMESDKLRKLKVLRYYIILGDGDTNHKWGICKNLNPNHLLQPYWIVQYKKRKGFVLKIVFCLNKIKENNKRKYFWCFCLLIKIIEKKEKNNEK